MAIRPYLNRGNLKEVVLLKRSRLSYERERQLISTLHIA